MRLGPAICFLSMILFFLSGRVEIAYGADSLQAIESLTQKYNSIKKELENSPQPIPFHLESVTSNDVSRVDIYGVIKYSFPTVEDELRSSAHWCDILLLHDNVRACTHERTDDTRWMTVYEVNRFNDPSEDAYQMNFRYRLFEQQPAFFDIPLASPEGPFRTTDHRFQFEAIPLEDGTSFIHLRYSFRYTPLSFLAMNEFLAIFSRGRVGFTVNSMDRRGNPVYVDGLRGVIERNTVRYYLALLAYLDTLRNPLERRFEERISRWYDLTALFRRQLFDMQKEEYLADKREDQANQRVLQAALGK